MTADRLKTLVKSKTLWGAIGTALGWLASQPRVGAVEIIQAVGGIVTAAGVRDAITQHGIAPDQG